MNVYLLRTFRWLLDAVITVWFFKPLKAEKKPKTKDIVLGLLCLAIISPIYIFSAEIPYYWLRFVFRCTAYVIYLRSVKGFSLRRSLYYSIILWLAFNICTNLFLTASLSSWFFGPSRSQIPGFILLNILYAVLMSLIREALPFPYIPEPGKQRLSLAILIAVAQLLIKEVGDQIARGIIAAPQSISFYLLLTQLLLGISLVIFERFQSRNDRQSREHLEELSGEYRYQSAMAKQEAAEDIRKLHHDMKNHLLAMQQISGNNERLNEYISGLIDNMGAYELRADTGNSLLDGLVSEKMRIAAASETDMTVALDVRQCSKRIADIDICIIFGNLLDNAIEASKKLQDKSRRSILVKSSLSGDNLVINISNFYEGKLQFNDGLPQTTKADKQKHGIGLSSVRKAVEKYGGTIFFRATEENRIIITILIPQDAETY